jgi:hypothetical protein
MTEEEKIEALKNNYQVFWVMPKELQDMADEIGVREFGLVGRPLQHEDKMANDFYSYKTYCLRKDYLIEDYLSTKIEKKEKALEKDVREAFLNTSINNIKKDIKATNNTIKKTNKDKNKNIEEISLLDIYSKLKKEIW